jgi:sulfite reductase alpha subunit-like flavoprotein
MAHDVNAELVKIMSKFGKLDPDRSAALLNRMKDEGRYCEDIFGQ